MQVIRQFKFHLKVFSVPGGSGQSWVRLYHVAEELMYNLTLQWGHGDTDCNFKTRERLASRQCVWVFIGGCDCCQWIPSPSLHTSLLSVIINLSWSLGCSQLNINGLRTDPPPPESLEPLPIATPNLSSPRTRWAICSNHHCSWPLRLFSSPGIFSAPYLKGILRV